MRTIGVMSGTSCDGADAVLLGVGDPDRREEPEVLGHHFVPFPATLSRELAAPGQITAPRLAELHHVLPEFYARAVQGLPEWASAEVVGCHGQTVWHAPPSSAAPVAHTLQIGSPSVLAARLGIPVVGDFRAADVALGGEGAPISPIAHYFFTPAARVGRLVVNVGGIANVTFVGETLDDVRASDVGPGNMIADRLCYEITSGEMSFDENGTLSATAEVHEEVVAHILSHPFFARPEPRSTGREDFGVGYTESLMRRFAKLESKDLLKSAFAATAEAITRAAEHYGASEILLTGGGAKNPTLRALVGDRAGATPVVVIENGPFAPSIHEPAAMALIALRTLRGLPSNLPKVTGASRSAVLGVVARPA